MQHLERQYRSTLWWNRFWLVIVATIAVVGASGLAFRFFFLTAQENNRRVETVRTADGGLRIWVVSQGNVLVTHLISDLGSHSIIAALPAPTLIPDSGGPEYSRREIEKMDWRYGDGEIAPAPPKDSFITALYYRPERSVRPAMPH